MERWDQLYTGGYRFCFGDGAFKPSTDTFLLGGFAQVRRGERVCDLGAGIGLPGLMLLSREPEVHITDIDIDEAACALARRSAEANGAALRAEGQPHTAPAGAAGLPAGRRHGADRPHTAFITGRTRRRIPGAAPHLFQRQGVMTQWQVYCIW